MVETEPRTNETILTVSSWPYPISDRLLFYTVARNLGYPIRIIKVEKGAIVFGNRTHQEELEHLLDRVYHETRAGFVVQDACLGAPHDLKAFIENNQNVDYGGKHLDQAVRMDNSPRVSERMLAECYLEAYEHVDGYRPYGNQNQGLDDLYQSFKDRGFSRPISFEGMALVLHGALQYLGVSPDERLK